MYGVRDGGGVASELLSVATAPGNSLSAIWYDERGKNTS